jgi:hypothetical protein
MSAAAPKPIAKARYGLERVKAGVYFHPASGRYILQTDGWEGPQGGQYSRWDLATWLGGWTVDPAPYPTLREAAAALDKESAAPPHHGERR